MRNVSHESHQENTAKRPPGRPRVFLWWRCWHGFPTDPKWRVVARETGCSTAEVVAVAAYLLDTASRAKSRGSVEDFSVIECGEALGVRPDTVQAILAALEAKCFIDQGVIPSWYARQPDREDPNAAERQRRRREQRASERDGEFCVITPQNTPEERRAEPAAILGPGTPVDNPGAEPAAPAKGLSREEVVAAGAALLTSGPDPMPKARAYALPGRWSGIVGYQRTVELIEAAAATGLAGAAAAAWIEQEVRSQLSGLLLPLGPTVVASAPDKARRAG